VILGLHGSSYGWGGRSTPAGRNARARKDWTDPSATQDRWGHFSVASRSWNHRWVGNRSFMDHGGRSRYASVSGFLRGMVTYTVVSRGGPGLSPLDYVKR